MSRAAALTAELALPLDEQVIATRRDLHRYAEPGWCEIRTTSKIVRTLEALGLEVRFGRDVIAPESRMGMPAAADLALAHRRALEQGADPEIAARTKDGFTGAVGVIRGARPGPTVALRFDIDANLGRESDADEHAPARGGFASVNAGVHHNCGHDGHTAMGLGAARALAADRAGLAGEMRLIFQPAEEGLRGARAMLDAGVVDGVDALICCHIGVQALAAGEIIAGYRNILGSIKLDAAFEGRNAHAAISPQEGRNALLAACAATLALHALPRHGDGETRVNVGTIEGGESRNAVAAHARIAAEIRGDTGAILDHLAARAEDAVRGAAAMQGVAARIEQVGASCPASSDPALAGLIAEAARSVAGVEEVRPEADFKGSDDAAILMDAVQNRGGQAVYFGLGSRLSEVHHHPRFDFAEEALPLGVAVIAAAARRAAGGAR